MKTIKELKEVYQTAITLNTVSMKFKIDYAKIVDFLSIVEDSFPPLDGNKEFKITKYYTDITENKYCYKLEIYDHDKVGTDEVAHQFVCKINMEV